MSVYRAFLAGLNVLAAQKALESPVLVVASSSLSKGRWGLSRSLLESD